MPHNRPKGVIRSSLKVVIPGLKNVLLFFFWGGEGTTNKQDL